MTPDFPSLPELIALAAKLSLGDFVKRFSDHYLITECIGTTTTWAQQPEGPNMTRQISGFTGGSRGLLGVTPVAKREGANTYGTMITLGRARNNDVPVTDVSVSKLHAWVRREGASTFTITDAGSRNGTFVNGEEVHGDARPLPVGGQLRLGLVEFRFVDGFGLHMALRSAPAEVGVR